MECGDSARVITFFWDGALQESKEIELDEAAAQHAKVRRVSEGEAARVLDGKGRIATGKIGRISKSGLRLTIDRVTSVAPPTPLELVVPVADKDRMLWAAEKCAELQITRWIPTHFARSKSVSPRGEGDKFREKVDARMRAALEQSGGAWLPQIADEAESSAAFESVQSGTRLLLDAKGERLGTMIGDGPLGLAVGPEGGLEMSEVDAALSSGWRLASIGSTILRFETAAVAAVAAVRATQIIPGR